MANGASREALKLRCVEHRPGRPTQQVVRKKKQKNESIGGTHLLRTCDISEVGKKETHREHPPTACSPCYRWARAIDVSATETPDDRAVSSL